MTPTGTGTLRYAGFLPRFCASLLDVIIWLPILPLYFWGFSHYRLFHAYAFVPNLLVILLYHVFFVSRFGGTPGKLIVGLRILKVDGDPITIREASLRYGVDLLLSLLMSIAMIVAAMRITDEQYFALGFVGKLTLLQKLTPWWEQPLSYANSIWVWGELFVLLTNEKRRALHDFIAGTVVVHKLSDMQKWELSNAAVDQTA